MLAPAALADEDKMALAARMQIAGQLQWKPSAPVSGQVNLEGTTVAALEDEWTEKDNGYWPVDGRLRLDGFTYGRFGGDKQATVEQRLKWICGQYQQRAGGNPTNFAARLEQLLRIRSQHPPRSEDNFATQPYEQLAAVYQGPGRTSGPGKSPSPGAPICASMATSNRTAGSATGFLTGASSTVTRPGGRAWG